MLFLIMTSNSMNFESASQEIIDFIKKETEVRESKGIVLGMSGGIDSTVLAYLATRAIGSKNVKGLILPDESVTPPDDIEDALTICSIDGENGKLIYRGYNMFNFEYRL